MRPVMVALAFGAALGVMGCQALPSRVVGIRSSESLVGEEVSTQCRDLRPEVALCRVEQRWTAGKRVEALPPQAPARALRSKPAAGRTAVQTMELEARASLVRVAPMVRHPLTSGAFGLRSCSYRGGCTFGFAVLTTGPGVPIRSDFDGVTGQVVEGVRLAPGTMRTGYSIALRGAERSSAPGGPFVGAGFAWREGFHPRTTVGWAFYAPDWAEHALALDMEPGRAQLVPSVSAVSPGLSLMPSVGLGVGLPVRWQPGLAAGARGQVSVAFPYVTLLGTLDVFPPDEAWAQPAIALALSL